MGAALAAPGLRRGAGWERPSRRPAALLTLRSWRAAAGRAAAAGWEPQLPPSRRPDRAARRAAAAASGCHGCRPRARAPAGQAGRRPTLPSLSTRPAARRRGVLAGRRPQVAGRRCGFVMGLCARGAGTSGRCGGRLLGAGAVGRLAAGGWQLGRRLIQSATELRCIYSRSRVVPGGRRALPRSRTAGAQEQLDPRARPRSATRAHHTSRTCCRPTQPRHRSCVWTCC